MTLSDEIAMAVGRVLKAAYDQGLNTSPAARRGLALTIISIAASEERCPTEVMLDVLLEMKDLIGKSDVLSLITPIGGEGELN